MGDAGVIRVAALTSGRRIPSARFRVRQHISSLARRGIQVREHAPLISKFAVPRPWPAGVSYMYAPHYYGLQALKLASRTPGLVGSWLADVTWLERQVLPGFLTLEPLLQRPIVFDVDDAIWLMRPWGESTVARTAAMASIVVVGNEFLRDWFAPHAADVRVVPTAIDTRRFHPRTDEREDGRFTIAWTGSAVSLGWLQQIEADLAGFMRDRPESQLLVIADRPPEFSVLPAERVRFVPWSPKVEAEALRDADVGLMPLGDTAMTRGKCSFKMLQYMATGIPVIVSEVGMNREVLALGDVGYGVPAGASWRDALEASFTQRELGREQGVRGRQVVEQHFSKHIVAAQLAQVFRDAAR